jgi:UDP-glucose 4-epimerase
MSNVLITGGCGFIGTQLVFELNAIGHTVTVVDHSIRDRSLPATLINADYAEFLSYNRIKFDLVIHNAAEATVQPSLHSPSTYYENNVIKMKTMMDAMVRSGIKNIIFSSTGNIYGNQTESLLKEDLPYSPVNAYASTKVVGELMIKDYARAYGINYLIFRLFNISGADPSGKCGYFRRPYAHLIPTVCRNILDASVTTVYGNAVRDYVHVQDIATAYSSGIDYLLGGGAGEVINLGGGKAGVSTMKIIQTAEAVIGLHPRIVEHEAREGDPVCLRADITKAHRVLDWKPKYSIEDMIFHAWNWERKYETNK